MYDLLLLPGIKGLIENGLWICECEIEIIQKCYLMLELDDYKSDYETLIKKKGTTTMENKRLRLLAIELFKTISSIKPRYMKNIFTSKVCKTKRIAVQTLDGSLKIVIFNKSRTGCKPRFKLIEVELSQHMNWLP